MEISRRELLRGMAGAAVIPGFLTPFITGCAHSIRPDALGVEPGAHHFARTFGMDESLISRILARALAKGGDFAELFFEHSLDHSLNLEDGAVSASYASVTLGCGVRVVQGARFGYAFTEELTLERLAMAADAAALIASGPAGSVAKPKAFPSIKNLYPIQTLWETLGMDQRMPALQRVEARIKSLDPRIVKASVGLSDSTRRIYIASSDGIRIEDYQPMASLRASCVAEAGGRRERNGFNLAGRQGMEFFTQEQQDKVAAESVRRTVRLLDAVQPSPGEYPLVLGPGPSGILLHEAIGHGLEADFNRKKTSIFSEKMGKSIAIPEVTIIDSALWPHTRGAINVDDEGNAGTETVLVEKGVLASYLHDRMSARHYGVAPTGSGRRESFRSPPIPRMRNTYMLGGSEAPEDIVKGVSRGIYAESFTNGQVQIGEGSFSFYIDAGFMIENGKLTAPIKDVNIIGNGPEVLARIAKVGNDLQIDVGGWTCGKDGQGVPVSQGLPTTLVSKVTVGGASRS